MTNNNNVLMFTHLKLTTFLKRSKTGQVYPFSLPTRHIFTLGQHPSVSLVNAQHPFGVNFRQAEKCMLINKCGSWFTVWCGSCFTVSFFEDCMPSWPIIIILIYRHIKKLIEMWNQIVFWKLHQIIVLHLPKYHMIWKLFYCSLFL